MAASPKVSAVWPALDSTLDQTPRSKCKYVTSRSQLGDGNFSVVKECMNVHTRVRYAMKLVPKKLVRGRLQLIQREVSILKHVSEQLHMLENRSSEESTGGNIDRQGTFDGHHHVLQLFDYFETRDNIILVTQLCKQGDLYDMIINAGSLDVERQVKPYTACLLSALNFLHNNGILHRDIKAENILFRLRDQAPPEGSGYDVSAHDLIVADFGLAVRMEDTSTLKEYVGTLSYLAPEVVRCKNIQHVSPAEADKIRPYGPGIDIWALGVLCYFMMGGYMPFDCEDDAETTECILQGDYYVDEEAHANAIVEYKNCWDFIQRCFTSNDAIRPSAQDLMGHIFVREYFQSVAAKDFSYIPLIERSKSSNSLHNLGPPSRSPLVSTEFSFIEQSPISRSSSREKNLSKLKDTLRKTLSMTSIEPKNNIRLRFIQPSLAQNQHRKNSTFVMEPEPPSQSLMNGCFSITPESHSNFNVTPAISRKSSGNNILELARPMFLNALSPQTATNFTPVVAKMESGRGRTTAFQVGDEDDI
ncbi:HCL303Cp [Eremothecium sinecaudum]|uniref:HCL303Cp n=1 Tax=Eremothecium sinecaudum TaxID=45286 RepID=A0A109UYB6_9SACH|nr:HCL303Cp [Eremothecium sinecaudum]AMD19848.1 HCL303Cp [Eremothecium sinecaudum]